MSDVSFAHALATAQGAMSGAAKDSKNPHFRSAYASLASVVDAIRGPLAASGIGWTQAVDVEGSSVAVRTILLYQDREYTWGTIRATAKDSSPQAIGSTTTYLRRYSLMAALGVPAEDDDAEGGQRREPASPAPVAVAPTPLTPHPLDAQPEVVDAWLVSLGKSPIKDRDPSALRALRQVLEEGNTVRGAFDQWAAKK